MHCGVAIAVATHRMKMWCFFSQRVTADNVDCIHGMVMVAHILTPALLDSLYTFLSMFQTKLNAVGNDKIMYL